MKLVMIMQFLLIKKKEEEEETDIYARIGFR